MRVLLSACLAVLLLNAVASTVQEGASGTLAQENIPHDAVIPGKEELAEGIVSHDGQAHVVAETNTESAPELVPASEGFDIKTQQTDMFTHHSDIITHQPDSERHVHAEVDAASEQHRAHGDGQSEEGRHSGQPEQPADAPTHTHAHDDMHTHAHDDIHTHTHEVDAHGEHIHTHDDHTHRHPHTHEEHAHDEHTHTHDEHAHDEHTHTHDERAHNEHIHTHAHDDHTHTQHQHAGHECDNTHDHAHDREGAHANQHTDTHTYAHTETDVHTHTHSLGQVHEHVHTGEGHDAAAHAPAHSHKGCPHHHGRHQHQDHHQDEAHGDQHDPINAIHRKLDEHEVYPITAVVLTCFSGFAAILGGFLVILTGKPSPRLMGHMLSFAAGIMLYISYGDLLAHAIMEMSGPGGADDHDEAHHEHHHGHDHGHNHGSISGFVHANAWLFVGMVFFLAVSALMPHALHEHDEASHPVQSHSHSVTEGSHRQEASSNGATNSKVEKRSRSRSRARASTKPQQTGDVSAVDNASASNPQAGPTSEAKRLLMTGLMAAVGISLHNLPEGLIVYNQTITGICEEQLPSTNATLFATLANQVLETFGAEPIPATFDISRCLTRGIAVTLAIFLHNIPEGMAVASPVYVSTGSKWQAMKYCIISAVFEPLAAVIFGVTFSSFLTPYIIAALNASVAGIMISLCLVELLPVASSHIGTKEAALSNIFGQLVMFLSLAAMRGNGVH